MKNLIYQNYTGSMGEPEKHSSKLFKEYADRIGAEYRLDINPNIASKLCDVSYYYEIMNFMLDDKFLQYDNVLIVDMDVFPVYDLSENIFEEFAKYNKEFGICTEPYQGILRKAVTVGGGINSSNDEKWNSLMVKLYGVEMPRDDNKDLIVYNSGMVLVSNQGIKKAKKKFDSFQNYINNCRLAGLPKFYTIDQNYLHSQIVAHCDYVEMDNGWNGYVHYDRSPGAFPIHDGRTENSRFVHIQLSGAGRFDNDKLDRITNLEIKDWKL